MEESTRRGDVYGQALGRQPIGQEAAFPTLHISISTFTFQTVFAYHTV